MTLSSCSSTVAETLSYMIKKVMMDRTNTKLGLLSNLTSRTLSSIKIR
jgi:hypothetical protein